MNSNKTQIRFIKEKTSGDCPPSSLPILDIKIITIEPSCCIWGGSVTVRYGTEISNLLLKLLRENKDAIMKHNNIERKIKVVSYNFNFDIRDKDVTFYIQEKEEI